MLLCRLICAFEAGVKGVKVVIAHLGELVVRVKCLVDSFQCNIIDNNRRSARTTLAIVPADLQSAGIEYKDLMIRLKYRCITKVNNEKFNAMFALKV